MAADPPRSVPALHCLTTAYLTSLRVNAGAAYLGSNDERPVPERNRSAEDLIVREHPTRTTAGGIAVKTIRPVSAAVVIFPRIACL